MNILLEIGMEEIPARFLKQALSDMENFVKKEFGDKKVSYDKIKTNGTPRRLVIEVTGLVEKQEDIVKQLIGPAKNVAYNNGELTKAGLGFLKSQQIEIDDVKIIKNEKGEYIGAEKIIKGVETEKILPELMKNLILSLNFPKSMKWGDRKMKFARPVRWILALADSKLIDIEIENIKSDLKTRGHRFFGAASIDVTDIEDYYAKLKENNVIVNIEERKNKIVDLINEKCAKTGEKVLINPELLDEVTNLVEHPYPIVCTFNPEFLEVPQEVLIITLETHQRYFPVLDANGKLLPKFVVIRNGIDSSEFVRKGNEKVVIARLADARFFFNEDLKKPFESFADKLNTVVFQKDLGTISQKMERAAAIAGYLCDTNGIGEDKKNNILRTVYLAKADLTSNMIGEKEYTKLQGFMGMEYALKSNENKDVAKGIYEHYMPRFQGDTLPASDEGAITAISDKIDTIVGCFGVGLIPSGSQDPYALRRAALGVINIILNSQYNVSFSGLITVSTDIFAQNNILKRDAGDVKKDVMEFIKQRIVNIMVERNHSKDIVDSVVEVDYDNVMDVEKRIKAIEAIKEDENFSNIISLVKRVKNISKDHNSIEVEKGLFKQDEEKSLYEYYLSAEETVSSMYKMRNYDGIFGEVVKGREVINTFFDKVMVMDKDEKIKTNRLSLLKALNNIFNKVAVMSMIND